MEQDLKQIYSEANKDLTSKWDEYMKSIEPKLSALQSDYDQAKLSGDADLIRETGKKLGQATRKYTLENDRYRSMVDQTTVNLANVNQIAMDYVNGKIPVMYSTGYNALGSSSVSELGGYRFDIVDEYTVKNLASENKIMLPAKKINVAKDKRWNTKAINSQLMQGILQGESIDKIAERLGNVVNMNQVSAVRSARTMATAAENKGRQDSYTKAAEDGVILKKVWISTPDERVRESHAEMNGEEVDPDDVFSNGLDYPGDPGGDPCEVYNCRCTMKTRIVGFKRVK